MSKVEIESFFKSFTLFFTSLSILIASLFYLNYTKDVKTLDEQILSQMRVCSFNLKCNQFKINFITKKTQELYTLYKDDSGLTSYYPIPQSQKNLMLFHLPNKEYQLKLKELQYHSLIWFFSILFVVFILSVIFSMYALYPLRNALLLTQEFIKDILHDFNTPISSLRLNTSMLKHELPNSEKIQRIEQSVQNILNLQNHLRSYLENSSLDKELVSLKDVVEQDINLLQKNYPNIRFDAKITHVKLHTNKDALIRVIDNILSNAAKYNKANGFVNIYYDQKTHKLHIQDSGKGIQNPTKIFERFYKEQERGIGIGLHIVKKLCEEMQIDIEVKSTLGVGSEFILNLSKLTLR